MNTSPASKRDVAALLRTANESRTKAGPTDLSQLNRVLQHTPEDMTVTVEPGITLGDLQAALARRGQWLPVDPAHAERVTISSLLSENLSGPRRFGFGTIRDHLIGLEAALADGRLVRSGGKVVKNVAGFDLLKLFIGARDSLGLIVEATFKLLPLPETEHFVRARCRSLDDCERIIQAVLESAMTPTVLDCHNLGAASGEVFVVLGFSGSHAEVDWQLAQAAALGFSESCTLDHDRELQDAAATAPLRVSVLPSKVAEVIRQLGGAPFVARAGNGVVYHRSAVRFSTAPPPPGLLRRVKDVFDPNHILPELSA